MTAAAYDPVSDALASYHEALAVFRARLCAGEEPGWPRAVETEETGQCRDTGRD